MHLSRFATWFGLLHAVSLVSAIAIAQPATRNSIQQRSTLQGWSLQSSTCPAGDTSCGNGACCPSSLFCIANANDEVDACCTTSKCDLKECSFYQVATDFKQKTLHAAGLSKEIQSVPIIVGLYGRDFKEILSAV
jgi:hypothetical protein